MREVEVRGRLRLALLAIGASPPWRVAATTLVAYVAILIPLIGANGIDSLIRVGSSLTQKSDRSPRISNLHTTTRVV
jgi:hypothetical protein